MHNVVIEKPYAFVPPYHGRIWPKLLQQFVRRRLRREFGVVEVECRGTGRLQQSLAAGHGILLAPNHSRACDPMVVNEMCRRVGTVPFIVASWHLFMQNRLQTYLLRRAGAFSIYREGMDRAALNASIDILNEARRPLLIFPEGVISHHNDRLNSLMEGTAFIARSAAKRRAKADPPKQVVVHPVALKYFFRGDVNASLHPVLDDIENRLSWRPQRHLELVERIYKVGESLLCLKEMEHLGQPQTGAIAERLTRLIDHLLVPLETEWLNGHREPHVVGRVKKLRTALLPDMVNGEIADVERERRWRQLSDMYLAQQLSCYPPDYVKSKPSPERMMETVERFEEDLTDKYRIHSPITVTVQVGEAITVSTERERGGDDPLMTSLEQQLRQLLEGLP